ncbi:MAG TPA: hypothetical protein VMG63_11335 [Terriglobia bacterium]|jgi:hypothetical protein|nr:hypothetical protein [Terriglobia bacterium]
MKINNRIDPGLRGKALQKPPASFKDDREIARWARQATRELEPDTDAKDPNFHLACFLAASSIVGPDEARISRMLGLPSGRVAFWAENLRRAGIWQKGAVRCETWYDEKSGTTGFILAMLVAEGLVESRVDETGVAKYRAVAGREWWQNN